MIIHLLVDMINTFVVIYDKRPKKIILSFKLEKEFIRELSHFIDYDKEYQNKAEFKGINIEYNIQEDFIQLLKPTNPTPEKREYGK